jgi:hypothetical protein
MKTKNSPAYAAPAVKALIFALVLFVTGPVFSLDFADLKTSVDAFSTQMAGSLPLHSLQGLNWSSAYIGQLLGIPPHFGVGASVGVTLIEADGVKDLAKTFGAGDKLPFSVLPNPAYTVEGRIGGFILPFDMGLKVGYLPPIGDAGTFQFDYLLVGGDLRYGVLKDSLILPAVSVGFGVNYLKGGITVKTGNIPYTIGQVGGSDATVTLQDPTLNFGWETLTFELKAQVSKSLLLVTPYAGLGIHYATTKAGYTAKTHLTLTPASSGSYASDEAIKTALEDEFGVKLDGDQGFSSIVEKSGFGLRLFGGISFNLAVIKLDVTLQAGAGNGFSLSDMSYAGSLGIRFQL